MRRHNNNSADDLALSRLKQRLTLLRNRLVDISEEDKQTSFSKNVRLSSKEGELNPYHLLRRARLNKI
jgi:hypothetical protein